MTVVLVVIVTILSVSVVALIIIMLKKTKMVTNLKRIRCNTETSTKLEK